MSKNTKTILGINPGAKYLGIAIMQGSDLREWGVKIINGKWSEKRMDKIMGIIDQHVCGFNCDVIAMKKVHPSRSSAEILVLAENIRKYCNSKKLAICEFSIKELETFYSEEGKINNKRDLAEMMVREYSFLSNELQREKNHKNPYYVRMFEAVALALRCFR